MTRKKMPCANCGENMDFHRHESWPKHTYSCACGLEVYWAEGHQLCVLVDPLDQEQFELTGTPVPDQSRAQLAHANRVAQ